MTPSEKIRAAYPEYAELIFKRTMEQHGKTLDKISFIHANWTAKEILAQAFLWFETPEGHDFWVLVHLNKKPLAAQIETASKRSWNAAIEAAIDCCNAESSIEGVHERIVNRIRALKKD